MKNAGLSKWFSFLSFVAMAFCCLGVLYFATISLAILHGRMQVVLINEKDGTSKITAIVDAEKTHVRGGFMVRFAETVSVTVQDSVLDSTKAAVASVGILRLLPQIASLVLLAILCFHIGRRRVFSRLNTKLILSSAIVMLCASALVPLINFCCILSIVNALGENDVEIRMDRLGNIAYFLKGFVLLFIAGVFRFGERAGKEYSDTQVKSD